MGSNKAGRHQREVGSYGNKRGKERQRRRINNRLQDPRYQTAMEAARQAQAALDARMTYEAANPVVGTTVGAELKRELELAQTVEERVLRELEASELALVPVPEIEPEPEYVTPVPSDDDEYIRIRKYKPFDINSIPAKQEGRQGWTLGNSRQLLIKGHSLSHVVSTTGWGQAWFSDIPVDEDGYGLGQEAWLNAQESAGKAATLSS